MIPLDLTKKIAEAAVLESLRPIVTVTEECDITDGFTDCHLLVMVEIPSACVRHELRLNEVHLYSFEAWARVLAGEPPRPGIRHPLLGADRVILFELVLDRDRRHDRMEQSASLFFPREILETPILAALKRLRASGVVFKADDADA